MNNLKLITVGVQIKTIYSIILFSLVMMVISENKVKAQQVQGSSSISLENVSYGNHPNQVIDLRKAKVDKPAPLVVFIHGGGFKGGSHDEVHENAIQQYLDEGIHDVNFGIAMEERPKLNGVEVILNYPKAKKVFKNERSFLIHHLKK